MLSLLLSFWLSLLLKLMLPWLRLFLLLQVPPAADKLMLLLSRSTVFF